MRIIALVVVAWALAVGSAAAETRVALVIANSAYSHAPRLPNPPRDAAAMAQALRGVGFTTVEVKGDQDKAAMEAALKTFAQAARDADVAVIYYAGHSLEQGGLNYLVPTDATLASDADVEFETIPLKLLERSVEGAGRLQLIILDACRNNPFATTMRRTGGTRAVGRGLARIEPEGDTLIAYAAREGSEASDGDGGNSPYTTALVKRLATPGLEIRILFGQVRDDVLAATSRTQEPAVYGSLGGDPFYFVAPTATAATGGAVDPAATERAFWQSASAGDDPVQLRAYLKTYPQGAFASLARARLGAATPAKAVDPAAAVLGMTLAAFDDAARARVKVPVSVGGVLVEAVAAGSEAAAQGVRAGDLITHLGGRPMTAPADAAEVVQGAMRGGRPTIAGTLFRPGDGRPTRLTFQTPGGQ